MLEAYYNLRKTPFTKDISPDDIFISCGGAELSQRLQYIKQQRGIMLVTGPPGVGKTLHLRVFVSTLSENLYKPLYIPLSTVNIIDFYRQICIKLGSEPVCRKSQLFSHIQDTIKDYVENNKKIPVIIFDEAHLLANENFCELQIISNFYFDSQDPAIFILTGQPHLRDRLLMPIHQSFNQRISLKFHLGPLSQKETGAYIAHHMKLAGTDKPIFNENAICAIYQASAGISRIINNLCIKTLTIGAFEKRDALTEEEVYRASHEL